MSKESALRLQGIVREVFPNAMFKVELCDDKGNAMGKYVRATISGKLRTSNIRILKEDKVEIELSVYDLEKGRIVWRYR